MLLTHACRKDPALAQLSEDQKILQKYFTLPKEPYNYAFQTWPDYLKTGFVNAQKNTPANNGITDWGATLGRVLFYDKALSSNHTVACASCHIQAFGFTDTARLSKGVNGLTKRHSMALGNAAYYANGRFFWDERAAALEYQVLMPIQDQVEMAMRLDSVEARLRNTEYYPVLFRLAFGSDSISSFRVSRALAQFVRAMLCYRSKYDVGRLQVNAPKDDFPNFTPEENLGKAIFFGRNLINCAGCHITELFVLDNPRNNGLSLIDRDSGIFRHSGDLQDVGKFKAPSLRNVGLRHRFMHDGSLVGLDAVVEHYNSNIQASGHLDPHLKDPISGMPYRMGLNAREKQALMAFLNTLTDQGLVVDPQFSSPWR